MLSPLLLVHMAEVHCTYQHNCNLWTDKFTQNIKTSHNHILVETQSDAEQTADIMTNIFIFLSLFLVVGFAVTAGYEGQPRFLATDSNSPVASLSSGKCLMQEKSRGSNLFLLIWGTHTGLWSSD